MTVPAGGGTAGPPLSPPRRSKVDEALAALGQPPATDDEFYGRPTVAPAQGARQMAAIRHILRRPKIHNDILLNDEQIHARSLYGIHKWYKAAHAFAIPPIHDVVSIYIRHKYRSHRCLPASIGPGGALAETGRLKAGRREGQLESRGGTWRTRCLRTLHARTGSALVHGAFLILTEVLPYALRGVR